MIQGLTNLSGSDLHVCDKAWPFWRLIARELRMQMYAEGQVKRQQGLLSVSWCCIHPQSLTFWARVPCIRPVTEAGFLGTWTIHLHVYLTRTPGLLSWDSYFLKMGAHLPTSSPEGTRVSTAAPCFHLVTARSGLFSGGDVMKSLLWKSVCPMQQ